MSETTNIEWATSTGSPWLICTEKSPGCLNCYARELAERKFAKMIRQAYRKAGFTDWETMPIWGNKAPRILTKSFWKDAVRLNAKALKEGTRPRMFPSLDDVFDDMPAGIIDQDGNKLEPISVLAAFLKLVSLTPSLDWLLLTKRPENVLPRLRAVYEKLSTVKPSDIQAKVPGWTLGDLVCVCTMVGRWIGAAPALIGYEPPRNVWLGVSVEDQKRADERIPLLLQIPAKVRFLSIEPLLEYIRYKDALRCDVPIHWVIVGGESGKDRRDCGVNAIVSVAEQALAAGVPVFVKQDCAFKPGQQGHIPADVWTLKQFPTI